MAKHLTNSDKILQAVLQNEQLEKSAGYNSTEFDTISKAFCSENPIVYAVAKIIDAKERNASEKEIYTEVTNYLISTLL